MKNFGFSACHPISVLIYYFSLLFITFSFSHPTVLAVLTASVIALDIERKGKKAIGFILTVVFPLCLLFVIINPIFNHYGVTQLFVLPWGNSFTLEALITGVINAVRFACTIITFDCLGDSISDRSIIFIFGRFSPKIALIAAMILRSIPLFRSYADDVTAAREGLGISGKDNGLLLRSKASLYAFSALVSRAVEGAADTSASMLSRGYGTGKRTQFIKYRYSAFDVLLLLLSLISVILYFFTKKLFFSVYSPIIDVSKFGLAGYFILIFYTFALNSALIYDIREKKLWLS